MHVLRTLGAAAALLLSAMPAAPANTLRIGLQADPSTLDPAQSAAFVDRVVMAAVCDKLIELDAKLAYVPQLATEWSWAADGLSLTMKLRAGVTFHDGEPFDAEAVRFNIERYKTAPYSRRQSELAPVKSVTVVDPVTVRFELSEPYAPLLAQLADRAGMMVSPKAARELGDKLGDSSGLRRAVPSGRMGRAGPARVREIRALLERRRGADRSRDLSADPRRHGAADEPARRCVSALGAHRAERSWHRARRSASQALRQHVGRLPRAVDQHQQGRGRQDAARQQSESCARRSSFRSTGPSSIRSRSMARSRRPTSRKRPARRSMRRRFRCRRAISRAPRRSLPRAEAVAFPSI